MFQYQHLSNFNCRQALDESVLRRIAPSIFAAQRVADVSGRYTFLSTATILQGLKSNGWPDLWATLNRIQENIIRGGQRDVSKPNPNRRRIPKTRPIKGSDEDLRLNKALWRFAEVLRGHKQD
jgi:hypothetical protein